MHYGCGSRRAPREVLFSISFSCRYSIYISLLKTFVNILETFLKSFGKHQDWVTHSFFLPVIPWPNSFHSFLTIPWSKQVSFPTIPWSKHFQSHFFSEILFEIKTSTALQQPSQPSMTEDSAIRIDLHSAEVVHFTHTIRVHYPDLHRSWVE